MKNTKPKHCAEAKKLLCYWTDKKNYLVLYKMLNFYVRLGMIVDKTHGKNSIKQSKSLEKNLTFNTQKRNKIKCVFEKDFYKLLNNAFYGKQGKMCEIV